MSGGGGASTTQNQSSASGTNFPNFYNSFLSNAFGNASANGGNGGGTSTQPGLFDLLGSQMSQMPANFAAYQGGGTAPPMGGVFNGGGSQVPNVQPIYPQAGQFPSGHLVSPPAYGQGTK